MVKCSMPSDKGPSSLPSLLTEVHTIFESFDSRVQSVVIAPDTIKKHFRSFRMACKLPVTLP